MGLRQSLVGIVAATGAAIVMCVIVLEAYGVRAALPVVVVALLACVFQAMALLRVVSEPMAGLTRMAKALASGDVDAHVQLESDDEFGELGGVLNVVAREQSRRLAFMRTEEERLTTVLDGMVEAVLVTDGGGEIVLANRAFRELQGSDPVGKKSVEVLETPALRDAVWAALRGETSAVSVDANIGGEERSLSAHVSPLPAAAGAVVVLHDVTELKRVERIRRDFVANASHELRTPLTAIRGFAETLAGGAVQNPAQAARFVEKILTHSLRLQRLADDLIALSRAEAPNQTFEAEPVALGAFIHEVVGGFEGQAAARRITLAEEAPAEAVTVDANRWALEHILMNLVDNAIKYTPEGGHVIVRHRAHGDAGAVVEVEDNGAGIPREHQDRIFERFYRVDSGRSRDRGGTGLGLAIVKHLAQRMNGEVRVESEPGKGTSFVLTLP